MIYSELYGAYYNCVADIIRVALCHKLTVDDMNDIITARGFSESSMNIIPAITKEEYKLIRKDGTTPIKNIPTMPLTTLQKRWLKSVTLDPRFRLFGEKIDGLDDVEPLFTQEDMSVYDSYSDGDPYEDEHYIKIFRTLLKAVRENTTLDVTMRNRSDRNRKILILRRSIEYSEKDDKFRVIGSGKTINISRIVSVSPSEKKISPSENDNTTKSEVTFELINTRNALERVMFHFAHFEKEATRIERGRYMVTLKYDPDDETELLIRLLSFGPMIKVMAPQKFVCLMEERIQKQFAIFFP